MMKKTIGYSLIIKSEDVKLIVVKKDSISFKIKEGCEWVKYDWSAFEGATFTQIKKKIKPIDKEVYCMKLEPINFRGADVSSRAAFLMLGIPCGLICIHFESKLNGSAFVHGIEWHKNLLSGLNFSAIESTRKQGNEIFGIYQSQAFIIKNKDELLKSICPITEA